MLVPPDALAELLERRKRQKDEQASALPWASRADIEWLFREAQRIPITR